MVESTFHEFSGLYNELSYKIYLISSYVSKENFCDEIFWVLLLAVTLLKADSTRDDFWENFKIELLYSPWIAVFALIIVTNSFEFLWMTISKKDFYFFFFFFFSFFFAFLYISNTFRPSIRLKVPKT